MSLADYVMRNVMTGAPRQISFGWWNAGEWHGLDMQHLRGEVTYKESFGGEFWRRETNWKLYSSMGCGLDSSGSE